MIEVRVSREMYEAMRADLARPHEFAAERVGFSMGRIGITASGYMILLTRYCSVPDEHYIDDPTVGARIGTEALTAVAHAIYHGRAKAEGVFHVHVHEHYGKTGMSRTDRAELPKLCPAFAPWALRLHTESSSGAWTTLRPGYGCRGPVNLFVRTRLPSWCTHQCLS